MKPVVLSSSALAPNAMLLPPVVLKRSAGLVATLPLPVVFDSSDGAWPIVVFF